MSVGVYQGAEREKIQPAALTDRQSVSSRCCSYKEGSRAGAGREVSRRVVLQSAQCVRCLNKACSNETSWRVANPWCWWEKPTGSGEKPATLEPNVGPLEKKKPHEGMEPDGRFAGWEQMRERVSAMQREQAEANRQFLEGLQDRAARQTFVLGQLGVVTSSCDPSELRTSEIQKPSEVPTSEPQQSLEPRTPEPQESSEPWTSKPQ
ncbi:hypothetical protein EYF80_054919 [Liparis tanakae]|uniref:Uncharacterized protein n=1 Tax=Liparis tanakae TaxID=230148 RepID=A0A4Z2F1A9_9TELE|nr:hypothetical protein EYF80_054919 [Liparis tanakae]